MPRPKGAYISSVPSTLPVSSTIQAIKSAHSCVKDRTHFKICLVGATLYHYYPSEELSITPNLYFPPRSYLFQESIYLPYMTFRRKAVAVCCARRGRSMLAYAPRDGRMSLALATPCVPSLPVEVDSVSFADKNVLRCGPLFTLHTPCSRGSRLLSLRCLSQTRPWGPDSLLKAPLLLRF